MTILYTSSHTTKGVTVPSSLDVRLRKDADRVEYNFLFWDFEASLIV